MGPGGSGREGHAGWERAADACVSAPGEAACLIPQTPADSRLCAVHAGVLGRVAVFPPPRLSDSQDRLRGDSLNFANPELPLRAATQRAPGCSGGPSGSPD